MKYFLLILTFFLAACPETYQTINGCDLYPNTSCPNVNLSYLPISWTDLSGSNFTGAQFRYSVLSSVIFKNAILDNTDFSDARVYGTDFTNASCKNIRWTDGKLWLDGSDQGGPCPKTNGTPPPPPPPPPAPPSPKPQGSCPITSTETCYDIFGSSSYSSKEIGSRYRELTLLCHPDKGGTQTQFVKLYCCKSALLQGDGASECIQ